MHNIGQIDPNDASHVDCLKNFTNFVSAFVDFVSNLFNCLTAFTNALKKTADPFNKTAEQTLAFQKAKGIFTSNKVTAYFRPGPSPATLYRRKFKKRFEISLEATAT